MRPDFPEVVDSTLIAAFRSCPAKAKLQYFDHWKPKSESVHLIAGAAYARGLEVARRSYYFQRDQDLALSQGVRALLEAYGDFQCPEDSAKSPERMAGALEYYFSQYGWDTDDAQPHVIAGAPCIEFSFAEPLSILHPRTGNPLIYSGRADMIVRYADGLWVLDDKTTSALGASWVNQWNLRSQFTAYTWAARRVNIPTTGVLVRGIAILKRGYNHAQAMTMRAAWEVERWERQLERDLLRMIQSWEAGEWDYNLDHACTEYGGCIFSQNVCKSPTPESWLPMYFERRRWDPLTRTETLLEPQ